MVRFNGQSLGLRAGVGWRATAAMLDAKRRDALIAAVRSELKFFAVRFD